MYFDNEDDAVAWTLKEFRCDMDVVLTADKRYLPVLPCLMPQMRANGAKLIAQIRWESRVYRQKDWKRPQLQEDEEKGS